MSNANKVDMQFQIEFWEHERKINNNEIFVLVNNKLQNIFAEFSNEHSLSFDQLKNLLPILASLCKCLLQQ